MKKLYIPENEGIPYFVHNDHFGSLKPGPRIDMFNSKTVMVPEAHHARATELLTNFLDNIKQGEPEPFKSPYSLLDKIRMVAEALAFGWFIPGKKGGSRERPLSLGRPHHSSEPS